MQKIMEKLRSSFAPNEPIFTRDVLSLLNDTPRSTVYYQLERAVSSGSLSKSGHGVYYIPTDTVVGPSIISPLKPLARKYITDNGNIFGYWGGLMLENQAGLTTQNPTVLEIATNKATKRLTRLGPMSGYRDVVLRPPRIEVSAENVDTLKFLDLVTDVSDLNSEEAANVLFEIAQSLDGEKVLDALKYYPSKTSKKLIGSGLLNVLA
ncbi:MAG: hypothetical protein Q4C41_09120 [Eggerthellaceae bacterium]|nr:hypothetical protein [Eggerthellaceae bacterium]